MEHNNANTVAGKKASKFRELGMLLVLIGISAMLAVATPSFINPINIINVIRQTVEIGIMGIGMTFIIVGAEIDLSIGSIYGVSAMIAATMLSAGMDPTLSFIAAITVGAVSGYINGFLTTKARMPSFIVTLGTMQILRSIAFGVSNGYSISTFPDSVINSWVFRMGGSIGFIPIQVIIMILLFVMAHIVLKKSIFGFKLYATGGNTRAAQLGGINISAIKTATFVVAGILSAFAGMISIAFLQSVPTTAGQGREMDVIAAVILGGAALSGGRGTIVGTLIGALIMSVIRNGMVLIHVPAYYQLGFIGLIIIIVVFLDTTFNRKKD